MTNAHPRHEARTRLIFALSAIESMSLDEALFQTLAAAVKLRESMTPEQCAELDKRTGMTAEQPQAPSAPEKE